MWEILRDCQVVVSLISGVLNIVLSIYAISDRKGMYPMAFRRCLNADSVLMPLDQIIVDAAWGLLFTGICIIVANITFVLLVWLLRVGRIAVPSDRALVGGLEIILWVGVFFCLTLGVTLGMKVLRACRRFP